MNVHCCILCGRWGTRQFRAADSYELKGTGLPEGPVCTNDRACRARRAKADKDALGTVWPVFRRAGKTTWQVVGPADLDAGMWVEVARRDGEVVVVYLDKIRERLADGRVVARTSGTKRPCVGDTYRDLNGNKHAIADAPRAAAIEAHRIARQAHAAAIEAHRSARHAHAAATSQEGKANK